MCSWFWSSTRLEAPSRLKSSKRPTLVVKKELMKSHTLSLFLDLVSLEVLLADIRVNDS